MKSLLAKIENLPPDLQKEVEIFLEKLLKKEKDKKNQSLYLAQQKVRSFFNRILTNH